MLPSSNYKLLHLVACGSWLVKRPWNYSHTHSAARNAMHHITNPQPTEQCNPTPKPAQARQLTLPPLHAPVRPQTPPRTRCSAHTHPSPRMTAAGQKALTGQSGAAKNPPSHLAEPRRTSSSTLPCTQSRSNPCDCTCAATCAPSHTASLPVVHAECAVSLHSAIKPPSLHRVRACVRAHLSSSQAPASPHQFWQRACKQSRCETTDTATSERPCPCRTRTATATVTAPSTPDPCRCLFSSRRVLHPTTTRRTMSSSPWHVVRSGSFSAPPLWWVSTGRYRIRLRLHLRCRGQYRLQLQWLCLLLRAPRHSSLLLLFRRSVCWL